MRAGVEWLELAFPNGHFDLATGRFLQAKVLLVAVALPKRGHSKVRWNGGKLILVQSIREPKQSVRR